MEQNFLLDLIASLKKTQSQKQVKEDIKNLGDIKIPLIGTLNKSKTKSQIKQDLSSLNGTINLTGKVDKKGIATSLQQATAQAQKQVDSKPVEVAFSVKKEKLINDIKLLAQQNSKLFKNTDMSIKYNSLLDNAELAKNTVQLSTLRTQLGSFRSELKVTGNAGLTMTDALKRGLTKVLQLFGSYGIIVQFTTQLRKAWTEAKELDKAMTDLSRVNAAITRDGFPDYLDRVISKTKQLAVATKDYIDAVTTFSRAGYNLTDSEILADMAVQLEKVGDMDSVSASKSLLAGLQGYIEIDGYGMDQFAEKAQALNDKIDLIGNTASITQAELSQGIQAVGSVMNDANTSVDEFLALLGAGNRAVQDSNKVALAIRTSALRIRGCTAELQEMGEETDNVIESTSTLAEKIKALTNINGSGGVNILEADEETFRSIYDIYNDISKVYDKMSDKDASALLDLIAGKNRSNQISAILQNMSEANELLERSLNATGTASAEYEIYLNSAQAATERFGVAMTETYSNIISGDTIKGLANAGAAVLDFANSWGILEGTLKGFLVFGVLKGVTTLTVAFKNSAVQISNYGKALDSVQIVSTYAQKTTDYANAMDLLRKSCVNLTDAQLKQVLANRNLSESQLIEILQLESLTAEKKKARLAQLGLIQTTETQTVAQGAATASTFSFSAAMKGLGASIKAAWKTNSIGIIIMGISTAIGVVTSAITKYNQEVEETRQKNLEAATTASEKTDKLKDLYNEYTRLASIQGRTTSEEEAFKTAVENITVALGNKAEILKDLTAGTDEYAEALARATKEELESQAVDATVGRKSAEEELQKTIFSRWSGSKVSIDSEALSEDAKRAVDIVSETLKEYKTHNNTWDFHFSGDMTEVFEYYNALIKAKKELVIAGQDDETLLDTKVYSDLNNVINTMSESMDTYIQQRYEEEKLIYMSQNGIPSTVEEYRNMENALIAVAGASNDLQDEFKEMLMSDFSGLATDVQNIGEAVGNAVANSLSAQLTTSKDALDKFQSSVKSAADAYATLLSGNYSSSELLDSIQTINQAVADMGGTLDWEKIDIHFDSMDLLKRKIEEVSEAYAKSILSDAGIDVDSKFGQMLANNIIQAQKASTQLEVLNDQIDSLQTAYSNLTDIVKTYNETGYITFDQLQTLLEMEPQYLSCLIDENGQLQLNEAAMTELANKRLDDAEAQAVQQAITELGQIALQDEKQAVQENAEAFTNAVDDLANYNAELANTIAEATVGASSIRDLNAAINGAESQGATDDQINTVLDNLNTKLQMIGNVRDKISTNGIGAVLSSTAESAGKEAVDAYLEAFEKELKELDELKDAGLISEKEYLDRLRVIYERYFKDKLGYEKEFAKYQKQYLDGYKSLYESVFSHASKLIDDRIDAINDEKDAAIDSLEAQKKAAEDSYNAQIALLEKKKDALQDEIDKIKEANEDRKEAIDLQKAEYELERAKNQRTILQYSEEEGLHYVTDQKAIRDAKNDLDDKKAEAKIRNLERQQDALDKQIDAIQDMLDASNEYWDAQIEQVENYYDTMVKGLEEYRKQWEELSDLQEHAEMIALLKELGFTEEDLLNQSSGAFENLRTSYLGILKDLNEGNQGVLDGLSKLANVDMSSIPSFLSETKGYIDSIANMDVTALSDGLRNVSNGFSNIADSASSAASAISGGGGNTASSSGQTASGGETSSSTSGGNNAPLTDAIREVSTDSVEEINKISDAFAGESEEGTSVTGAVQKVMDKIGSSDADKESSDTLMSTLTEQTEAALDEEKGIPAQKTAWEELNEPLSESVDLVTTLQSTLENMDGKEFTVTLNVSGNGLPDSIVSEFGGGGKSRVQGTAHVEGTVGKAFAEGTGKYKGLPHAEKNALVSEYGQTEMTVLPDGNAVITDEPTMMDLPKDTVIYNEDQTKQILDNKVDISGKAYSNDTVVASNSNDEPVPYDPDKDDSDFAKFYKAWNAYYGNIDKNVEDIQKTLSHHLVIEHNQKMNKEVDQFVNNSSSIVNNNRNVQPVVNQEFHITLPNVTNSTSAESLLNDLQSIATKKFQVNW